MGQQHEKKALARLWLLLRDLMCKDFPTLSLWSPGSKEKGRKKNSGTASLRSMGFWADQGAENSRWRSGDAWAKFSGRRVFFALLGPVLACPSVKIFNPACRRGSIGRGPWLQSCKKGTNQNRVESDSLGPFVLVSRHLRVWLIRLGLALSVTRLLALAFWHVAWGGGGNRYMGMSESVKRRRLGR